MQTYLLSTEVAAIESSDDRRGSAVYGRSRFTSRSRAVKWVTRHHARVNRIATAWLIRRFIDPNAEFIFTRPDDVARIQQELGAKGFDAPGAIYPHKDAQGRCSFEALVAEHCSADRALQALARIVHCADFPDAPQTEPAAEGLRAISRGFPLAAKDDHEALAKASFLYDALYLSLRAALE